MKGFNKAAIAAVTAATVTTSLCMLASAEETTTAGVTVDNNVCTITLNADEATLLGLEARQEVKKEDANTQLDALVKKISDREAYINGLDAEAKEQVAAASVSATYRACAESKELNETDYDLAGVFSSVKGEPNDTSLGLIICAFVLAGLGVIAALLPHLKGVLPAEIASLLP